MQNLHDPYRDAYLASRAQRMLVEKRSLCGPMYSSDPSVKFLRLWTLLLETRKSVYADPHPVVEAALQECRQTVGETADRAAFDACMKSKGFERPAAGAQAEQPVPAAPAPKM